MLCLCNDSRCKDSHDLKEAWWTLVALQSANQYNMAGLYKPGFPRLFSCFSLHESLLKMTMPNLHSHFVRSLQQHSNVLTLYLARPKKQLSPPCMQRNGFLMCSWKLSLFLLWLGLLKTIFEALQLICLAEYGICTCGVAMKLFSTSALPFSRCTKTSC